MMKSPEVAVHVPETCKLNKHSLLRMLRAHGKVILKPSAKYGGKGIVGIDAAGSRQYLLHSGTRQYRVRGHTSLYRRVLRLTTADYIVQATIPLPRIKGRPFDLRVMVQRSKGGGRWMVTGKLAKVAGHGFIITNIARSGGRVLPVHTALRRSTLRSLPKAVISAEINRLALSTAKLLQPHYPRYRMIGLDMGLDGRGKPWIIEANLKPNISLFRKLKNDQPYRRIVSIRSAASAQAADLEWEQPDADPDITDWNADDAPLKHSFDRPRD